MKKGVNITDLSKNELININGGGLFREWGEAVGEKVGGIIAKYGPAIVIAVLTRKII